MGTSERELRRARMPLALTRDRCGSRRRSAGRSLDARAWMGATELRVTHGHSRAGAMSSEYRTWQSMRARCYQASSISYPRYGALGITVCDRWRDDFAAFFADMGPKPTPGHSIDRIDNERGYNPDNCRWATALEQTHNRRITLKTHCKHGHPLSGDNLCIVVSGKVRRVCRICRNEAGRRLRAERKRTKQAPSHVCKASAPVCCCSMIADGPSCDCPIHGGAVINRCDCGRFVPQVHYAIRHSVKES